MIWKESFHNKPDSIVVSRDDGVEHPSDFFLLGLFEYTEILQLGRLAAVRSTTGLESKIRRDWLVCHNNALIRFLFSSGE